IPGAVHFHGRTDPTVPSRGRHGGAPASKEAGTAGCESNCPTGTTGNGAEEWSRSRPGPTGRDPHLWGGDHREKPPPGRGGWGGRERGRGGPPPPPPGGKGWCLRGGRGLPR